MPKIKKKTKSSNVLKFSFTETLKQLNFSKNIFSSDSIPLCSFKIKYLSILWRHFSPKKTVKIEKQKSCGCFEYKNLPFYKLWAQMDENCKGYSQSAVSGVLLARREQLYYSRQ